MCVYDVSDVCDTIGKIVRAQPDMEMVASVNSQAWPAQRIAELKPHVVVFDVMEDGVRQVGLVWMVSSQFPASRSMVVIDKHMSVPLQRLLEAGASGLLPRERLDARLADAIRVVAAGGMVLWREPPPPGPLTGPQSK